MAGMAEKIEGSYRERDRKIPQSEIPAFQGTHISKDESQNGKEYQDKACIDVFYVFTHETIIS
jgi:hypothetical protein